MGKSTISMAMFNCYVSSPDGTYIICRLPPLKFTQVEKNEDVYFYIATLNNQRVWTGGLKIWKSVENTE